MSELALTATPSRPELLRRVREGLPRLSPPLRVLAESILGAETLIDFVGVEPAGRTVAVLVGEEGEDLELVGRSLAQRAWLAPRLEDWLKLAPNLGIRPEAGLGSILLCPSYRDETRAAIRALGPDILTPVRYRCVRNGAGVDLLFEPLGPQAPVSPRPPRSESAASIQDAPASTAVSHRDASEHSARSSPPASRPPSEFRTGLSDRDLGLSPEEVREFK